MYFLKIGVRKKELMTCLSIKIFGKVFWATMASDMHRISTNHDTKC